MPFALLPPLGTALGTAPSKCGRNLFKKKKEKGKIPVADDVLLSSLPEGRRVKLKNRDKHFKKKKKKKKNLLFCLARRM
jgi:hypothetical protein